MSLHVPNIDTLIFSSGKWQKLGQTFDISLDWNKLTWGKENHKKSVSVFYDRGWGITLRNLTKQIHHKLLFYVLKSLRIILKKNNVLFKLTYLHKCQTWIRLSHKTIRGRLINILWGYGTHWNINVNGSKYIKNITTGLKFQIAQYLTFKYISIIHY